MTTPPTSPPSAAGSSRSVVGLVLLVALGIGAVGLLLAVTMRSGAPSDPPPPSDTRVPQMRKARPPRQEPPPANERTAGAAVAQPERERAGPAATTANDIVAAVASGPSGDLRVPIPLADADDDSGDENSAPGARTGPPQRDMMHAAEIQRRIQDVKPALDACAGTWKTATGIAMDVRLALDLGPSGLRGAGVLDRDGAPASVLTCFAGVLQGAAWAGLTRRNITVTPTLRATH